LAVLVAPLLEHSVVEHGVADRDRQYLVGLEAHRVVEAGLVFDAADFERAHTDAVGRDADANVPRGQLLLGEERLQGSRERLGVTNLAVEHDSRLERGAGELDELVTVLGRVDDRCRELRGADLEADDAPAGAPGATVLLLRLLP